MTTLWQVVAHHQFDNSYGPQGSGLYQVEFHFERVNHKEIHRSEIQFEEQWTNYILISGLETSPIDPYFLVYTIALHTELSLVPCDFTSTIYSEPFIKQKLNSSTILPLAPSTPTKGLSLVFLEPLRILLTLLFHCYSLCLECSSLKSPHHSWPYFIQVSAHSNAILLREIFLDHAIQNSIPHPYQELAFIFFIAFVTWLHVTSLLQLMLEKLQVSYIKCQLHKRRKCALFTALPSGLKRALGTAQ